MFPEEFLKVSGWLLDQQAELYLEYTWECGTVKTDDKTNELPNHAETQ